MRRAALLALLLAPISPVSAFADVTPDRAAALQQQIRDWIQSTLGDAVPVAKSPVAVTAAGDHYDVSTPLGTGPDAPLIRGKMTEAGGGRWAVDDVTVPSPSVFHYQLPPAKKPGAIGGDVTTTITIGQQQGRMLLDPTFATPSTWTSTVKDVDVTTQASNGTQLSHFDTGMGSTTVTPVADGRVNMTANSSAEGYTMKMGAGADRQPLAISIGKLSVVTALNGLSRERGSEILRLIGKAGQQAPGGKLAPATMDRETSIALLTALFDLAGSVSIDEKVSDLTITVQDMTGSLQQASFGLDSTADGGKLHARMPIAAAGLTLPDLGLGSLAQFVPTRLTLTPNLSGVPTAAVMGAARKLADKREPDDTDIRALFSQGPIDAGIDDFHLDVAGSSIAGNVKMLVSSPNTYSGTGQITAENIDRLQQAMTANPQSAQIAPLLIFLKGIGRAEQNRLVWDVVYRDNHLVVNGQDMAALMGAAAPPAQPRPAPARPGARPAPSRP